MRFVNFIRINIKLRWRQMFWLFSTGCWYTLSYTEFASRDLKIQFSNWIAFLWSDSSYKDNVSQDDAACSSDGPRVSLTALIIKTQTLTGLQQLRGGLKIRLRWLLGPAAPQSQPVPGQDAVRTETRKSVRSQLANKLGHWLRLTGSTGTCLSSFSF